MLPVRDIGEWADRCRVAATADHTPHVPNITEATDRDQTL